MSEIVQILMGFIGSLGFGFLFNLRGKRLVAASLGGLFAWALFILLGFLTEDEPVRYFFVSAAVSLYSEIMARVMKTPTTSFLNTCLIPLIPGGSLYYTMRNAFMGTPSDFMDRGIKTLSLAVALALGVIVVTVITEMVKKIQSAKRKAQGTRQ